MESKERALAILKLEDETVPFLDWLRRVRDKNTRGRIGSRLFRAALGNFGDWKDVGEGVYEMRLDFGPGYRVYFAIHEDTIIVILLGGDKSTQQKDIERAIALWKENRDETDRFQRRN